MVSFLRGIVVLFALLGAAASHALVPAITQYRALSSMGWSDSPEAAAQAYFGVANQNYEYRLKSFGVGYREFFYETKLKGSSNPFSGNYQQSLQQQAGACPSNSTAVSGGCLCNEGYDESGGSCVPHVNQCTAKLGETTIVNWTVCFFRTPDSNDFSCVGQPNKLPADRSTCSGGCRQSMTADGGPGWAAWRSQTPNGQGLYRGSLDIPVVNTGYECSAGPLDAPLSPTATEPPCPGYVGEINGKKGCYGTAEKPVITQPTDRPPTPQVAGNPSAGPKPATGEGSGTGGAGRTPSSGSGGNAGGPASAATGGTGGEGGGTTDGTGTVGAPPAGQEQAQCGAPGQPKCAIDETGTPTKAEGQDKYAEGVDALRDKQKEQIDGAGQKAKDSVGEWGFSFALPTGCTPLTPEGYSITIDPCRWQGTVHDLMSMVWLIVTAWACIGMVGRTLSGGS